MIPNHYAAEDADDLLQSHVSRYLAEEIIAEGVSRNQSVFSQFLEAAGVCNTQQLDYFSLASDAGVARQTVQNYFQILKDTLLRYEPAAWTLSLRRKAMVTPKFSFFDLGIVKALRHLGDISEAGSDFSDFFGYFFSWNYAQGLTRPNPHGRSSIAAAQVPLNLISFLMEEWLLK